MAVPRQRGGPAHSGPLLLDEALAAAARAAGTAAPVPLDPAGPAGAAGAARAAGAAGAADAAAVGELHPVVGRHVVVVGINFAPEPTGIAPYTTGLVTHLSAAASAVTVLTGVLRVAPADPPGLARAVRELRDDPARRARMSEAATAYARRELSAEAAMRRLDRLIEEAMS